jgi:hypothetical protein
MMTQEGWRTTTLNRTCLRRFSRESLEHLELTGDQIALVSRYALAHVGQHFRQVRERKPSQAGALIVRDFWLARKTTSEEAHHEVLRTISVWKGERFQRGIASKAKRLDVEDIQAGLFLHLAHDHGFEVFAFFRIPARQSPNTEITAFLEQNTTHGVLNDDPCPGHQQKPFADKPPQLANVARIKVAHRITVSFDWQSGWVISRPRPCSRHDYPAVRSSPVLARRHRRRKLAFQLADILDTDRDANEPLGDAQFGPTLWCQTSMRA